jgi:hypothetical protein
MIKTLTVSLVALLTIGSASAAVAASAGGLHRSGSVGAAHILKKNFGAFHGARRHGGFRGYPWIGTAPYDTPPADVSVTNNQFVVPNPTAYRRVCRSNVSVVPAEAGGEREVTVTRCFLE